MPGKARRLPPKPGTPRPFVEHASPELLRWVGPGFVVMTKVGRTFWRKGEDSTWHAVDPATRRPTGSRTRIETKYLQAVLGAVEVNAETERVQRTSG